MEIIFESDKFKKNYISLIVINFLLFFYFIQKLNFLNENNLESKNIKTNIEKIISLKKEFYSKKDFESFYNDFEFKNNLKININNNKILMYQDKLDNKIIEILLKELLNNNYYIDKLEIKKITDKESFIKFEVLNEKN